MADFGYSTIGGTNDNPADNWIWCKATSTPSDGTLTLIQGYCAIRDNATGTPQISMAIYTFDGTTFTKVDANDTGVNVGSSFGWVSQSFSTAITNGTQYWFGIRVTNYQSPPGRDVNVKFDTGSGTELRFKNNAALAVWPATASGTSDGGTERWSIYGTYTPSGGGGGGGGQIPRRMRFGVGFIYPGIDDVWKINAEAKAA